MSEVTHLLTRARLGLVDPNKQEDLLSLCRHCRHAKIDEPSSTWECHHPEAVHGEIKPRNRKYCKNMRMTDEMAGHVFHKEIWTKKTSQCRPEARYFEEYFEEKS